MYARDLNGCEVNKDISLEELETVAKKMRAYCITAIALAKSGHTGGVMSIIDIATALYFKFLRHDPRNPEWEDRDRVFWSAGHKAPALYAALGLSGYFDINGIVNLRKYGSGFEGHPNRFKLPGIEASSGSLGQGLGIAVGSALNAKKTKKNYRIFCIMGDGELQEGSIWEAAMSASHYRLDNLTVIIDRNRLQIDGCVSDVMEIEPLKEKWEAFGWNVVECNGHNIKEILEALGLACSFKNEPSAVIANTIKGKGISFTENICSYHGIPPKDGINGKESLETALNEINCKYFTNGLLCSLLKSAAEYQDSIDNKIKSLEPKFSKNYFWNQQSEMKVEMSPNRVGFGKGLEEAGKDPDVVVLGADITESIKMSSFYEKYPERKQRFYSMGIAEQNMTAVAAGFAKEGRIPFIGSYGVFVTGRNLDQIRTTICYNNYNVKIVDAHGGISVGPDGATHQALEDISNLYYLPQMKIIVPVDSIEARKATLAIKNAYGPATIRIAREATPIVTKDDTCFEFGKANIIRYRETSKRFVDAFEIFLSDEYINENEDITIIACGPILAEAMRAAYILKEEYGIETRVINLHTIKPLDESAIIKAVKETNLIVTCEEHQKGGFGNIIAGTSAKNRKANEPFALKMIGVNDRFGESGQPWDLMKIFGLTAEFIANESKKLIEENQSVLHMIKS